MGFIVISDVLWFLPIAVALFAVEYTLIVRYEEGVLESIFGAEYLAYKHRTSRWFPRPSADDEDGEHHWGEAWRSETSTFLQYIVIAGLFIAKQRYGGSGWGTVNGKRGRVRSRHTGPSLVCLGRSPFTILDPSGPVP